MPAEDVERKVKGLLEELYASGDMKEAIHCIQELQEANASMAFVAEALLSTSLEQKGTKWEALQELLARVW
jgi:hypothetical protein